MRIRSQFLLTLVTFAALAVATAAVVIVDNARAQVTAREGARASGVALGASGLGYLANDYLNYRENTQRERWQSEFLSFSTDVSGLEVGTPEEGTLLRDLQGGARRLKEVFDDVASTVDGLPAGKGPASQATLLASRSRLSVQTQGLVSDAMRLSQLLGRRADGLKQSYAIALIIMLVTFGAYFLVTSLAINGRMLRSLAMLQKGAAVVGSGDLDFRIPAVSRDEIGDLAGAFNNMAADLQERSGELHHANTSLQMVSECNQAMVRARDEETLVREVCRIIRSLGGFPSAQVSYARQGQDGQDAAPSGSESRASCTFPLLSEGQEFGALAVVAGREGACGESEMKLLAGLAADLSFGISALRIRAARIDALRVAEERAGQLRALAAELEKTEQRERRRLASVLHDNLQQLLVGGKFSLSILQGEGRPAGEQEAVNRVMETLEEAIRLTRSLTVELSPPVLLEKGLVAGLGWLGREMERAHGLSVTITADPRAEPAGEDIRGFIYQAVRELLFNVVKHADVKNARVEMGFDGSDRVRISVSDSGRGFDPKAALAFGFGLFSIRERLGYLGGEMSVESSPGEGARFTLTIDAATAATRPAADTTDTAPPAGADTEAMHVPGAGAKIRVLLADDHQIIRQGLTLLLQAQPDIEIVGEAADGEEAVEMTRRLCPAVVLMDVTMPKTSGYEATRRIKSEHPRVRVIALSMHDNADMAASMREAGAEAYLNKGGPVKELIAVIRGGKDSASPQPWVPEMTRR